MLTTIDRAARYVVAAPLVLTGYLLTTIAEGLIRAGAWIADIPVEDED